MKYDYQLIIIGGGSGGLAAAELAHSLGLQGVALIEKDVRLGGECLHTGCVPSKALLHAAREGIPDPWAHVAHSIDTIEKRSDNDAHLKGLGLDVYHGAAAFVDPHTVQVGEVTYSARYFLISTGSLPAVPPVPGLEHGEYLTNETIFNLKSTPKRLAIIGSGPIGAEMATAFSALGSSVHVIERGPRILSRVDADASRIIHRSLTAAGVAVHTDVDDLAVNYKKTIGLTFKNTSLQVDQLLVAVGRVPNIDLGLEAAGVAYSEKGITVDRLMRTTTKHIYAIGDCTPSPKFTHLAAHQASVALTNMLSPLAWASAKRLQPTPAIIYTWPEVGSFGMTAEAAQAVQGSRVLHYNLADADRAVTDNDVDGFVKIVVSRWGRILSCTVVSKNASELLTPLLLLHTQKRSLFQLAKVVIPYPTKASILTNIVADQSAYSLRRLPGWRLLTRRWKHRDSRSNIT